MNEPFFTAVRPLFGGRLTQPQVDGLARLLVATAGLPPSHRAYILATAFHETARTMQPIHERGSTAYFRKYEPGTRIGAALGNTRPGDGHLFRGRGYVQLTGRANYARVGRILGLDLTARPDLALDPATAARILVEGMRGGWFTGRRLADYLPGDHAGARRIVNGTDRAAEIAALARGFEAALAAAPAATPAPAAPPAAAPGLRGLAAWLAALIRRIFGGRP